MSFPRFRNLMKKKGAQKGQRMTLKSTFGRFGGGFSKIWEAFGRGVFLMNFWSAKSCLKIE